MIDDLERFGTATAEFNRMTDKFYKLIQLLFPLPAGEGQGEGERNALR
ncbi:MAG TPA: hypothetical protein VK742_13285 [Candidatus Sulfotelmatobacter sp.]|jgi:hypothetical protein|nr:hypothetical protein [Candidatus Sulfotelmatobacter sp.]